MRLCDRFVNPASKPLQPGTVIICDDLPFVASSNSKIYNFTGGNMKQLYITVPRKHKFLVKATNSPSTFSNIFSLVLGLLPRFGKRQSQINDHKDLDQEQTAAEASTIKAIHTVSSGKGTELGNNVDITSEGNASDLANFCADESAHHVMHDAVLYQENMFPDHARNEMLSHYNRIVIGCFKDIFLSVNTNNLVVVLQALEELNFVLANRAPELAAHFNLPLEPQQISAEEIPNLVKAHLHHPTTYNVEQSIRGKPHSRGNQHLWYNRQSSPLPRYNQHTYRSDTHFYFLKNRNYNNTSYHDSNRHNNASSIRNMCSYTPNSSNMQQNPVNIQPSNTSDIIERLQSQILGLHMHPLEQPTLDSFKYLMGVTKPNSQLGHRVLKMLPGYVS